jgi:hypothetical protein
MMMRGPAAFRETALFCDALNLLGCACARLLSTCNYTSRGRYPCAWTVVLESSVLLRLGPGRVIFKQITLLKMRLQLKYSSARLTAPARL